MAALRSSKRATPRRRYTVDAFEGIAELQSEISSDDEEQTREGVDDESNEDGDEDSDEYRSVEERSQADDESMSGVDEVGPVEEADDLASDAGEQDLDDDISIADDLGNSSAPRSRHRVRLPVKDADGRQVYVRGILDDQTNSIKSSTRQLYLFGSSDKEYEPVYHAYTRWVNDLRLPSRQAGAQGQGGLVYSVAFANEVENAERNWSWYSGGGRSVFENRQVFKRIPMENASQYLQTEETGERSFVAGPLSAQKFYRLRTRQSIPLSKPFEVVTEDGAAASSRAIKRNGFLLNLGARVNCLDWAPSRPGKKQYLAVSLLPSKDNTLSLGSANAFTPQPVSNHSIQIWEFSATADGHINTTSPPRLCMVLCAEMGFVRELAWCLVPSRVEEKLGLLGCVTADGALRVFNIDVPSPDSDSPAVFVEKAAFHSKPPDTVCTSLTWLSSQRIAASCSNGFVAVWDISRSQPTPNPRPEQYLGVSTSYISSIVSGYPSFPNMIMTNALTGRLTLTDLTRPRPASPMGTALSPRSRISQLRVVWHDFAYMALSSEDNLSVHAHPLRRWFGMVGTNRLKSHATSMATSPCHPFVLIGTAGGEATFHNPMGRLVSGSRAEILLQPWFLHEWRQPTDDEQQAAASSAYGTLDVGDSGVPDPEDVKGIIGTDGLSRIVDGLKAYPTALAVKDGTAPNVRGGILFNTIYEEKTAVTSVAWNPNLHVGGWAAAGMADGLLRVEDVAR